MKIMLVGINSQYVHTNLAIRYIKSYCSEFDIKINEYTINDSIYNILSGILDGKPDIIGFSCYIWNIELVLKLCSSIKRVNPNIIVVLGGPEVSYDAGEIMDSRHCIDYIIKGEGEIPSRMLFGYLNNGCGNVEDIGGLVYRRSGKVFENEKGRPTETLDEIPFPYGDCDSMENRIVYFESSRGCPFNCSYCLSSAEKGVRFLSIDRVKTDLMWFINRNVRLVKFVDRTFNCGKQYLDILKFLVENRSNTRFHFEIEADLLDDKTIDFLNTVPAGLFQFEAGIQSTNHRTLQLIDRSMDFDKLKHNIGRLLKQGNIHIHLDLIAGLPDEDYTSFVKSFNDAFELRPHMLQLGFLKLLKGSSLRKSSGRYGIEYSEYTPYEVLKTRVLSFKEISSIKGVEETLDAYYNSGRFNTALKYVLMNEADYFSFFNNMSEYIGKLRGLNRSISNIDQYRLLYYYIISTKRFDEEIVKECLAFDYMSQGRNPSVPDFLHCGYNLDRMLIWDFFNNNKYIEKYLPHYTGNDGKSIAKRVHGRKFSYNIVEFLKSGTLIKKDGIIFFDYGTRLRNNEIYSFFVDFNDLNVENNKNI